MLEAAKLFKEKFGFGPTYLVRAPGRVELLGNHTDYNEGLVLALAVDKYVYMASSPRSDGKIELLSSAFPQRELFSVSDYFKNSCPELDLLVELARRQHRCLGARLTGGGFGGATINLVKEPEAKQFMQAIAAQYRGKTGIGIQPLRCQIVDGAA